MKFVLIMILIIVLLGVLAAPTRVQKVRAAEIIYIKPDGSIDPPKAPIYSADNVTYTLTGNIIYREIVVQRNNTIINGKGYTLEGTGAGYSRGIDLSSTSNVTIKNVKVVRFYYAFYYCGTPNNTIIESNIINNYYGVYYEVSNKNIIVGNNITNNFIGIMLSFSHNNNISRNNILNNTNFGIEVVGSDNIFYNNNISGSGLGVIIIIGSNNNKFYHNTFIGNTFHASIPTASSNIWDDGYPSGGNYWDDFEERYPDVEDVYSGLFQNETGSDGIWDHPYLVDANDVDYYPLVPEFPSGIIIPLFMIATLLAVLVYRRKHSI